MSQFQGRLHQGAAATMIDHAIDLAMSANPSAASQSGPDLSKSSSVARLTFLKLAAQLPVSNQPIRKPCTHDRLPPPHRSSRPPRRSQTRSQSTQSTSPRDLIHPPNGSVYGDAVSAAAGPGEPLTIERVEKLAQETTGIDKDNYAKMTQGGFKEHADA
jgi:hypothetical protein